MSLVTPRIPPAHKRDPFYQSLRELDAGSSKEDIVIRDGMILSHLNLSGELKAYNKFDEYPVFHHDDFMINLLSERIKNPPDHFTTASRKNDEYELAKYKAVPDNVADFYNKESWRRVYEREFSYYTDEQREVAMKDRPFADYEPYLGSYGVVDTPEQLLELYDLEADPRRFFVRFTEMRKEDQYPFGGWRWHKWGEYLGTQNPQFEYLYDEPEIESVFVFHIYQLVD